MRARVLLALLLAGAPPAVATEGAGSLPPDIATNIVLATLLIMLVVFGRFLLHLIYLKSRAVLADARLILAEKHSQLASVPDPALHNGPALSAAELDNIIAAGFPEVGLELRAALTRTIVAAIKDKTS